MIHESTVWDELWGCGDGAMGRGEEGETRRHGDAETRDAELRRHGEMPNKGL